MAGSHPSTPDVALQISLAGHGATALDAPGQWVVCGGAIRDATSGRVACPMTGSPEPVAECIGCRWLVTRSDERDPRTDCALP